MPEDALIEPRNYAELVLIVIIGIIKGYFSSSVLCRRHLIHTFGYISY